MAAAAGHVLRQLPQMGSAEHQRFEKLWGRWEHDSASDSCRRCSRPFSMMW
eukprot:SAG11_NODE_21287_length_428_cov_0.778116_1_plen_50_part_01